MFIIIMEVPLHNNYRVKKKRNVIYLNHRVSVNLGYHVHFLKCKDVDYDCMGCLYSLVLTSGV